MIDELEPLLKRWMQDRGAVDDGATREVFNMIADLPVRRRRQPSMLAAAGVIVALGLTAFVVGPRFGTGQASAPVAPDPAAFAGDPRLGQCGATVETALAAFEMAHARDYRLHLPGMLLSPELDVDVPAFVVVYREMQTVPGGAPPPPGQTWPPRSLSPDHRDVCVLVGADTATAERMVYDDVNISGMTAVVSSESPASGDPSSSTPSQSVAPDPPSLTPPAGPSWAGDVREALQCDGTPIDLGDEGTPNADNVMGDTPEAAVLNIERRAWGRRLEVPFEGFERESTDRAFALYVYRHESRVRAAIALTFWSGGSGSGWFASSVASCGDAEFDPATPTGAHAFGRWVDRTGGPVPGSTLSAVPDCYNGTQVTLNGRLYVRIPGGGVDPSQLDMPWSADVPLPATTRDTGYRSGTRRLFVGDGERALYLADGDRVERLPHVIGDEVSRTDCN